MHSGRPGLRRTERPVTRRMEIVRGYSTCVITTGPKRATGIIGIQELSEVVGCKTE